MEGTTRVAQVATVFQTLVSSTTLAVSAMGRTQLALTAQELSLVQFAMITAEFAEVIIRHA